MLLIYTNLVLAAFFQCLDYCFRVLMRSRVLIQILEISPKHLTAQPCLLPSGILTIPLLQPGPYRIPLENRLQPGPAQTIFWIRTGLVPFLIWQYKFCYWHPPLGVSSIKFLSIPEFLPTDLLLRFKHASLLTLSGRWQRCEEENIHTYFKWQKFIYFPLLAQRVILDLCYEIWSFPKYIRYLWRKKKREREICSPLVKGKHI